MASIRFLSYLTLILQKWSYYIILPIFAFFFSLWPCECKFLKFRYFLEGSTYISYFLVHLTTFSWFFDFDTIGFLILELPVSLSSCATSAAQIQFSRYYAIPSQISSITHKCCFILFEGILQDNNASCVHSRIG